MKTIQLVILFMVVAAFARIIPHMPNFTPTEGLTLFGAAYIKRKELSFILPIVLLYFSDLIINNTIMRPFFPDKSGIIWFSNYMIFSWISMLLITTLGVYLLKTITMSRLFASTLISSILFFIISNFGVWLNSSSYYANDISGLITCYVAALPFFWTSLIGTTIFTAVIFGGYYFTLNLLTKRLPENTIR